MARLFSPRKRHNARCSGGPWPLGCKCGDPGTIAIAVMVALGTAATTMEVEALQGKPKNPDLPNLPSLDSSKETALSAQTRQRQAALAAGGNTNITGGTGIILGSDVSSVSLVGSS